MASIGIIGGTFNPIHNGHIAIAQQAMLQYKLDAVWFMPNHLTTYKDGSELVSDTDRYRMIELAIEDRPGFRAIDYELCKNGSTYTCDTLKELSQRYPEHTFWFILGADSLEHFPEWRNPEQILQYAGILAAPRENDSLEEVTKRIAALSRIYPRGRFYPIASKQIPVSSHTIREQLRNEAYDTPVKEQLPDRVYEYIKKQHLYNGIPSAMH